MPRVSGSILLIRQQSLNVVAVANCFDCLYEMIVHWLTDLQRNVVDSWVPKALKMSIQMSREKNCGQTLILEIRLMTGKHVSCLSCCCGSDNIFPIFEKTNWTNILRYLLQCFISHGCGGEHSLDEVFGTEPWPSPCEGSLRVWTFVSETGKLSNISKQLRGVSQWHNTTLEDKVGRSDHLDTWC